MPRAPRPASAARLSLERANVQAIPQESTDVLSLVRESLPDVMKIAIQAAKNGDQGAVNTVLKVAESELNKAQTGAATDILVKIAEVRAAGSPILEALWKRIARDVAVQG